MKSIAERTFISQEDRCKKLQLKAQQGDTRFKYWGFKFPRGYINLLCGADGHGKTSFAIDMAINMRKKGLKVAFVSFDLHPQKIEELSIRNILSSNKLKVDLSDEEKEEAMKYIFDIYYLPHCFEDFYSREKSTFSFKTLLEDIIQKKYDAVFFDSLEDMRRTGNYNVDDFRNVVFYLNNQLRINDILCVCTSNMEVEAHTNFKKMHLTNVTGGKLIDDTECDYALWHACLAIGIFKMDLNDKNKMRDEEKKELEKYEEIHFDSVADVAYEEFTNTVEFYTTTKPEEGACPAFVPKEVSGIEFFKDDITMTITPEEKKELWRGSCKSIKLVYIKELKKKLGPPSDPDFKLFNFDYDFCKVVSEIKP